MLPEAIEKAGLNENVHKFSIPMDIRDYIIENYSRSPGVRGLKKYIQKICERIAFRIVEQESQAPAATSSVLSPLVG